MLESVTGRRALATVLAFGILIGVVYLVARNMVLGGFDSVDRSSGRETALRMRFALRSQGEQLENVGLNWADWTGAYDYVGATTSQERWDFQQQEMSDETLSSLPCDLFGFLSTKGDKIFVVSIDHHTGSVVDAPSSFVRALRESGLSTSVKSRPSQMSVILVDGEPLLVSIQRVHRSGLPSQWNGSVVLGQWAKMGVKKSLREQMRAPISIGALADAVSVQGMEGAAPLTNADALESVSLADNDDYIGIKTSFSDPRDRPVLWVATNVPRLARQQGLLSLHSFLIALLGLGAVSVAVALSLQKALVRTDEKLRRETQAFELITSHLPDPLFVRDLKAQTTRVYGNVTSDNLNGDWLDGSLPEEQRLLRTQWLEGMRASGQRAEREWKMGDSTWLELVTPVRASGQNAPVSHLIGAAIDISNRKQAEREKDVLLKEIHHRVKNNLQIVVSLLNLQADTFSDAATREGFMEARARVRSMALIHEQLYRQTDLSHVDFGTYLESLLQLLLRAQRHTAVRLVSEIESIPLDIDIAVPCGLIVTELVTNAFKHAFAPALVGAVESDNSHELTVRLHAEEGNCVRLQIEDNGPGLPADFCLEESESLGLQIVDSLATQLGATIEVGNCEGERGTRWTLCFEAIESSEKRIRA